ncbi:MAG TPA: LCP family protein [Acidimicrobiia bacterium]|nr:LCP family protein [Acidimicrobiia bacterium]
MPKRVATSQGASIRSLLLPGWGQMATTHPIVGRLLVLVTGLAFIALLTAFLFLGPMEMLAWLANPDVLFYLVVANVLYLLMRFVSAGFAYREGARSRKWILVPLVAVIVTIPHIAVAWVGWETRDAILTVFAAPEEPIPTTTTTSSTTTTTTTIIELSPIGTIPGQNDAEVENLKVTQGWRPFGEDRLNILLLGGDAGPGRNGLRTDTMIVASIDPVSGDAALIGLPRNYGGITLTDGTPIPVTQLGHVYGWGRRNEVRFGGVDPGAEAVKDALTHITGLAIDHYVLVDLTGFAEVVDAFGGVSLDVPEPVDGPLYDVRTGGYQMVVIPAGRQHLDGAHALAYSRARYGSSDYARMGRQRCVLASMAAQADLLTLFGRLGTILDVAAANLTTDMPSEMIPDLIRLTPRVSASTTRLIGFDGAWAKGFTSTGRAIPDIDRIREAVRTTIEDPDAAGSVGAATAEAGC